LSTAIKLLHKYKLKLKALLRVMELQPMFNALKIRIPYTDIYILYIDVNNLNLKFTVPITVANSLKVSVIIFGAFHTVNV